MNSFNENALESNYEESRMRDQNKRDFEILK